MISTTQAQQLQARQTEELYRRQAEQGLAEAIASYLEHFSLWDLQRELCQLLSKIALPSGRTQKTTVSFQDQTTGEYL